MLAKAALPVDGIIVSNQGSDDVEKLLLAADTGSLERGDNVLGRGVVRLCSQVPRHGLLFGSLYSQQTGPLVQVLDRGET